MKDLLKSHPVNTHADDIRGLTAPLRDIGIDYFAHVRRDAKNHCSALNNNPELFNHYMSNHYYNHDIHMTIEEKPRIVIWDHLPRKGKSLEMHQAAEAFGVNHTFTIIEPSKQHMDYYHFAIAKRNVLINEHYLRHYKLLELFIAYFNEQVAADNNISQIYRMPFAVDAVHGCYEVDEAEFREDSQAFLNKLQVKKYPCGQSGAHLTEREFQVFYWMCAGKSATEIADIFTISASTVRKHMEKLKEKLNCYNQFQLGMKWQTLYGGLEAEIHRLMDKLG